MKPLLYIFFISLIVKLVLCGWLPLYHDEAYYWVWSQHLQLSYFDHPPFVSWLFKLGHYFGKTFVRVPGVLLGQATLIIWYFILKDQIDFRQMKMWFVLALFNPFTGFGSLIITPDIPLVFFYSLSILAFLKWLQSGTKAHCLLLGCCVGAGFLSKYHIVLFFPPALWVLFRQGKLKEFATPINMTVFLLGFFSLSFPVWVWNMKNEWISFVFQIERGLNKDYWTIDWFFIYILSQFFILLPTSIYLIYKSWNRTPLWLCSFSLFPLIFFFFVSLKGPVQPNWTTMSYLGLLAMSVYRHKSFTLHKITVALWAFFFIGVVTHLITPLITLKRDKVLEPYEYKDLVSYTQKFKPMYGNTYQMASQLSFYGENMVYKMRGMSRRDFFDSLEMSLPMEKKIYLVLREDEFPQQLKALEKYSPGQRISINHKYDIVEYIRK